MGLANEEIIPPKEGIKAAGGRYASTGRGTTGAAMSRQAANQRDALTHFRSHEIYTTQTRGLK
jgi:hypothetical protein